MGHVAVVTETPRRLGSVVRVFRETCGKERLIVALHTSLIAQVVWLQLVIRPILGGAGICLLLVHRVARQTG